MTTTNKAKNSSTPPPPPPPPQGTETAQKRQRHLEAPDNDACDDADDIGDTFPVTITEPGTLLDSTGITDATERDALKCNNIFPSANVGVWYKVDGTGKPMRFSTCAVDGASTAAFYNTQILVYDNDCNDLNCVAANKIGGEGCGGTSSRVEIDSEDGTQYFVLVDHDDVGEGVTGQAFELAVIDNVPMNDYCETTSQVNVGDKKMADTTNASPDDGIVPAVGVPGNVCRSATTEMKGVWYEFIGTGKTIRLSTCSADGGATSFDNQISVYKRDCTNCGVCSQLDCVDSSNIGFGSCQFFDTRLELLTTLGANYRILVHGFDQNANPGHFGAFTLAVNPGAPANDLCTEATVIPQGVSPLSFDGTIIGATTEISIFDEVAPVCPTTVSRGVWYTFTAPGSTFNSVCPRVTRRPNLTQSFQCTKTMLSTAGGRDHHH